MRGLIHLAIVAAIAYFGYTQLWPRFLEYRQSKEGGARMASDVEACLFAAQAATDDFAGEFVQFSRPPVDPGLWSTFLIRTSSRLSDADTACRCAEAACLSAGAALLEQRELLNRFDEMVRGTSTGIGNPAAAIERIQNLLDRARAEAR